MVMFMHLLICHYFPLSIVFNAAVGVGAVLVPVVVSAAEFKPDGGGIAENLLSKFGSVAALVAVVLVGTEGVIAVAGKPTCRRSDSI